jgi:hypothetical protein
MTKPKASSKPKAKRGRPDGGKRGRVMAFYARPEVEKTIRDKAADQDKAIGIVIAEAVMGTESQK